MEKETFGIDELVRRDRMLTRSLLRTRFNSAEYVRLLGLIGHTAALLRKARSTQSANS